MAQRGVHRDTIRGAGDKRCLGIMLDVAKRMSVEGN